MSIDSKDFLKRLHNHNVRADELVSHMINGNSHAEIEKYLLNRADYRYVNQVLEEARARHAFYLFEGVLRKFV